MVNMKIRREFIKHLAYSKYEWEVTIIIQYIESIVYIPGEGHQKAK